MKGNVTLEIIGVKLPLIKKGDDLGRLIVEHCKKQGISIDDGDIFVVAQTVVSKSEGRIVNLNTVKPSKKAIEIARKIDKDPKLVEIILRESKEIVRIGNRAIITETKHGFICANAGVDCSNIPAGYATLLPENPDRSANAIRNTIKRITGKNIAVIISDSHGRAFRKGSVGVAVGIAGIPPLVDKKGCKDLFGNILKTTEIALADEIASAATLVMGESDEGIPVAIIKGLSYEPKEGVQIKELLRDKKEDLFR